MLSPASPQIRIYDFNFQCIWSDNSQELADPALSAVQEAQNNTRTVADFLSTVLADSERSAYNGIDGNGKQFVLNVNCIEECSEENMFSCFDRSQCRFENRIYENAGFLACAGEEQFFYGQVNIHGSPSELISYASSLTVVAHEVFHAVTYFQSNKNNGAPLGITGVSGSLNESYSDIFAIFVANRDISDVNKWDWNIYAPENKIIRMMNYPEMSFPPQAIHMGQHRKWDEDRNVYFNHGIHNLAAYKIITAKDCDRPGSYLFSGDLERLIKMFYGALKEIGTNPNFSSSRASILKSANIFFSTDSKLPRIENAINDAFNQVGIPPAIT
jgi:Thermolysin metallopeptidase, alpha-helical domain